MRGSGTARRSATSSHSGSRASASRTSVVDCGRFDASPWTSFAINSRSGACIQIENNYFSKTSNPWVSAFTTALGGGEIICNTLADGSAFMYSDADEIFALPACTLTVPYNYSAFLNLPADVPRIVTENAGVGKLANPESF